MSIFAMALLVFYGGVDVKAEATKTLSEIDKKLKLLNKPAIKSIKVYSFYYFIFFHCTWDSSMNFLNHSNLCQDCL